MEFIQVFGKWVSILFCNDRIWTTCQLHMVRVRMKQTWGGVWVISTRYILGKSVTRSKQHLPACSFCGEVWAGMWSLAWSGGPCWEILCLFMLVLVLSVDWNWSWSCALYDFRLCLLLICIQSCWRWQLFLFVCLVCECVCCVHEREMVFEREQQQTTTTTTKRRILQMMM